VIVPEVQFNHWIEFPDAHAIWKFHVDLSPAECDSKDAEISIAEFYNSECEAKYAVHEAYGGTRWRRPAARFMSEGSGIPRAIGRLATHCNLLVCCVNSTKGSSAQSGSSGEPHRRN
jgi:hypothetical protein